MRMRLLLALACDPTDARTGVAAPAREHQNPLPGSESRAVRAVPNIIHL
ncbi:hypothetical protein [Microvirga sp. P5_D2]